MDHFDLRDGALHCEDVPVRELAEHYLRHSELPIQDIACYLGFGEPRSFHRSFKQWTGQTPGEYRQRLLKR